MTIILTPTGWKQISSDEELVLNEELEGILKRIKHHEKGKVMASARGDATQANHHENQIRELSKQYRSTEANYRKGSVKNVSENFNDLEDEEILDLLEEFTDEELEEILEATTPQNVIKTVKTLMIDKPKHKPVLQAALSKSKIGKKQQQLDPSRWNKWGHKV